MIARPAFLIPILMLVACAAAPAAAQGNGTFSVRVGNTIEGHRPILDLPDLLSDRALQDALASGLPLRFHLRVELWERGVFDRLALAEDLSMALLLDPLDRLYRLETARATRVLSSLREVQTAAGTALRPTLQPPRPGRYYYLAALEVETLSLSDLDELRRWLRGEVQPAVEGRGSPGRAVERGLRRVVVRVLGIPTRRFETRSGTFVVR